MKWDEDGENTIFLQSTLDLGVEDLLRKIDPLPKFSGQKDKVREAYYQERALGFLKEMELLLNPLLEMAKKLKGLESSLVEFWKQEHISAQEMPRLAQLMELAASFITQTVQSLVDKKQEKKIQQVAAQIQELKELLCWLTYTDQTDETYEKLYQAKMRATRCEKRDPRLPNMLKANVPSHNSIYKKEVTYGLSGPKLYRMIFTGGYDQIELTQYFQYKCMEEGESTTEVQVVPLGKEMELVQKNAQLVQKNVQDHSLFIKDLGPEYTEYYQFTLERIERCNIHLKEGYTAAWVENCLTALFGSECAEELNEAFDNAKIKMMALIMGRLYACGIYQKNPNSFYAGLLVQGLNFTAGSMTKYVNLGQNSRKDKEYKFLDWLEDYCNAHRPKTSA